MKYNMLRKSKLSLINNVLIDLSSPLNISYMWNFGSLLGLMFIIQFMTGIFLTFHYAAHIDLSFNSVIHITRNVNFGWMIRYLHISGASFLFIFCYIHMSRGLFYMSFSKKKVWISGVMILLVLMAIAFMGYILPWGQMSFWGATVITNLISSIPVLGEKIVLWIWGGFSVSNPTLNRFFSFHFMFPFIMLFFIMIHIVVLHEEGSSNPLGLNFNYDKLWFYPYFFLKDFVGFMLFFLLLILAVFFFPVFFSDSENFIMANSLITPVHIQPEWYYLFSYAILRSIPSKLGGVLALLFSILIFLVLIFMNSKFGQISFYPVICSFYYLFILNVLLLIWVGANQVEFPFLIIGQFSTFYYFFFFFFYYYLVYIWDDIFN